MSDTIEVGWSVKVTGDKRTVWTVEYVDASTALLSRRRDRYSRERVTATVPLNDLTRVCGESVSDGARSMSFHTCGKPVKYPEWGLCGVHGGAKKRRAEKLEDDKRERAENAEKVAAAKAELVALGVSGRVETVYDNRIIPRYTGNVILSMDEVRRLAARDA